MLDTPANPFEYLLPVPPEMFLGRWPLVEMIARDLVRSKGGSHACIGGRRFGKSSLLLALHHYLRGPKMANVEVPVLPIRLDLKDYNFVTAGEFFAVVLQELRSRVDADEQYPPDDVSPVRIPLAGTGLDRLRVENVSALTLQQFFTVLREILDRLRNAAGPGRLVIILDEMDEALDYICHDKLFNQLRSAIYNPPTDTLIKLVVAGSRRFLDTKTSGSPIWNVLKLHYLATFDEATTCELTRRLDGLGEPAAHAVWRQSGGHPFLAQYLLHHLWEVGADQANTDMVKRLATRFRYEEQAHLEGWCQAIERVGLLLYGQLISRDVWWDELDLMQALTDTTLPIKRGLIALSYHGVAVHDGTWTRYRWTGDLFHTWYMEERHRLVGDQQNIADEEATSNKLGITRSRRSQSRRSNAKPLPGQPAAMKTRPANARKTKKERHMRPRNMALDPEQFIPDESRDQLLDALTRFADRVSQGSDRQAILQVARIHDGFVREMAPYDSPSPMFASKLLVKLDNYQSSDQNPRYHPLVGLLQRLPQSYDCPMRDQEQFQRLVQWAEENLKLLAIRRAVGRIESPQGTGIGTGTLIGPNTVLTCQHIFNDILANPERAWIRFGNQTNSDASDDYACEIDLDSLETFGSDLDCVRVGLLQRPPFSLGSIAAPQLREEQIVSLIHYPHGGHVVVSYHGLIKEVGGNYIDYDIPTARGSSGGPIFDQNWRLVGLHLGESASGRRLPPGIVTGLPLSAARDRGLLS